MEKRILIVGTVPYNEKSTSRAFASYFSGMKRENLAQIFSNTKKPLKGHCGTLYQITDQSLLKRHFNSEIHVGNIFYYDDLDWAEPDEERNNSRSVISTLYRIGKKKNSLVYLLRKRLWKKKYWCTQELNNWLDNFRPECIFLSFSDDFFILQIALYVAERFNIPIVSSIGDDYYFNYKKTLSPLYHIYKISYRALVDKVFKHGGGAIYIGDKIRDKYNSEFGISNGQTVYLTSSISRRDFRAINLESPVFSYFGNIRLGRNESIIDIGNAIGKINPKYKLNVYSDEMEKRYWGEISKHPNIEFHGGVPYAEVQKKTLESDVLIIVEGFKKCDVDITRYSLSTKVADSLASGVSVLAYGSNQCGAIEYAKSTGCVETCIQKEQLVETIKRMIEDVDLQHRNYDGAIKITEKNHRLSQSTAIFSTVVEKACEEYEK